MTASGTTPPSPPPWSVAMAEPTRLPQALRELEAAIDAEVDFAVLRAVRQRLNERCQMGYELWSILMVDNH